MIMLHKSWK